MLNPEEMPYAFAMKAPSYFPETSSGLSSSHFRVRSAPPYISKWTGLECDFV